MKKVILYVLVAGMLFGAFVPAVNVCAAVETIQSNQSWYSAETKEHHLETVNDLFGFLAMVQGEWDDFSGDTVYLDADITVNDTDLSDLSQVDTNGLVGWTDIGSKNFAGTFDGNGHTISGIYYETTQDHGGLFGKPNGLSATVQNLAIVNSCIVSFGKNVGSIFGYISRCTNGINLSNLYVDVDIYATSSSLANCGGLIGNRKDTGTITVNSCVYAGTMRVSDSAGNCNIGGLVGKAGSILTVTDSGAYGAIESKNGTIGGIVGSCSKALTVEHCIVATEISTESQTAAALYGTQTGSVTLTNNLYTIESIRPIPNSDTSVPGKYSVVSMDSLHGLGTMTLFTKHGFTNWKARLKNFAVPKSLIKMTGVKPQAITAADSTKLVGYQLSKVDNGKFSLRLVAVVDSLQYSAVGFQVNAVNETIGEKSRTQDCTTVYDSLNGYIHGTVRVDYTAEELGGAYIFALNINNIPINVGKIAFEANTYHIQNGITTQDGTVRFELDTDQIS